MLIRRILAAPDCTEHYSDTNFYPTGLAKGFQATLIAIHFIDPKYTHLETAMSPRLRRFEEILMLAIQEAYQHLDNVKQNAQLILANLGDEIN
jgi:hypothetical protein